LLQGLRIVVTRSASQAFELAQPLTALGAHVIVLPAIEIAPPADPSALTSAVSAQYDWILLTSANAVRAFAGTMPDESRSAIAARIACIGHATKDEATRLGFRVALTPDEYTAEALLPHFPPDMHSMRVLIPRSALARDVIPDELRTRGAEVTVVEAYRNIAPPNLTERAREVFATPPDWVLFASSSAVHNLCSAVGTSTLSHSRLASIGPATSATIRQNGLPVAVEASLHTAAGLVEAIQKRYAIIQRQ
jgi:uroporphyrinogen-III synthase